MPLSTWLAVLAEVKQQVAHATKEESKANGSWVDLAEGTSALPSHEQVTQRWQQQQWQNAFEVLVCPSVVAREFALNHNSAVQTVPSVHYCASFRISADL
jgi:hypothetical protein